MCGVVGYVGSKDAVAVLLDGLRRLEYRGYDSAGVAVLNGRGVETRKLAGRIAALRDLVAREPVHGTCGIGHTRWATHGAPTEQNAHPHTDCTGTLALVHNGIVENADLLRLQLERAGHRFATETDTETLAHLIEAAAGDTLEERVIAALALVEGTYGLAVISEADPRKIVVARRGSPLPIGVGGGECLVASDASAVLAHTRSVVYLDKYVSPEMEADFLPSIIKQGTYNHHLYSLGQFDSGLGIYANKQYLSEAGVRIPTIDNPWTLTEFNNVLAKLKNVPGVEYPLDLKMSTSGEWFTYGFSPFVESF